MKNLTSILGVLVVVAIGAAGVYMFLFKGSLNNTMQQLTVLPENPSPQAQSTAAQKNNVPKQGTNAPAKEAAAQELLSDPKILKTKERMQQSLRKFKMYKHHCGSYPKTQSGYKALLSNVENCKKWGPQPYIKRIHVDFWGRNLMYKAVGQGFELWSYGADGKVGGEGINQDIPFKRTY